MPYDRAGKTLLLHAALSKIQDSRFGQPPDPWERRYQSGPMSPRFKIQDPDFRVRFVWVFL
jgi:hypothetical protein